MLSGHQVILLSGHPIIQSSHHPGHHDTSSSCLKDEDLNSDTNPWTDNIRTFRSASHTNTILNGVNWRTLIRLQTLRAPGPCEMVGVECKGSALISIHGILLGPPPQPDADMVISWSIWRTRRKNCIKIKERWFWRTKNKLTESQNFYWIFYTWHIFSSQWIFF